MKLLLKRILADPSISVAAIALIIAGFFFIHDYNPRLGIIGNASRGQIWFTVGLRLPYRFLLGGMIAVIAVNVMSIMTQKGGRPG